MSSETKSVSIPPGGHPDESQLLLALERELPADEFAEIEQHVGTCWSCRARSDEIRRGILGFVEYREKRYLPLLESPPSDFRSFPDRLRTLVREYRRPNVFAKAWRRIVGMFALPRTVGYAAVVAAVMAGLLLWTEILHPPVVSASELLTRSMAAQSGRIAVETPARRRVVHQRVEIRGRGKTVVREFQWPAGRPIPLTEWPSAPDPAQWTAPLTAQGFVQWRDSLLQKSDDVQRSGDLLTLRTRNTEHAIREAVLEVRHDDFRPIRQHLRFADGQEVQLRELDFEVREVLVSQQPPRAADPRVEAPESSSPSREDAELEVWHALFVRSLDVNEDITIKQEGGAVAVSGIVSTPEREAAMRTALAGLPGVRLFLRAPAVSSEGGDKQPGVAPATAAAGPPLLNEVLESAFSVREDRLAFVDRVLGESDAQMSQAWALKRLLDRYGSGAEFRLSNESREKLYMMLRAHLEAIRRRNGQSQLLALMAAAPVKDGPTPNDWRDAAAALFGEVREQDAVVARLVVGTQAQGMDVSTASARFRSLNGRIDALARAALSGMPPNPKVK